MNKPSGSRPTDFQRLDKWLWAARFFKTRNLAIEAINGGKVHVDGQRVKPARSLRRGSEVRIRKGPLEFTVIVHDLCSQRRPASEAALLYQETEESRTRREALAEQRRLAATRHERGAGRPSKKDRRHMDKIFGR